MNSVKWLNLHILIGNSWCTRPVNISGLLPVTSTFRCPFFAPSKACSPPIGFPCYNLLALLGPTITVGFRYWFCYCGCFPMLVLPLPMHEHKCIARFSCIADTTSSVTKKIYQPQKPNISGQYIPGDKPSPRDWFIWREQKLLLLAEFWTEIPITLGILFTVSIDCKADCAYCVNLNT